MKLKTKKTSRRGVQIIGDVGEHETCSKTSALTSAFTTREGSDGVSSVGFEEQSHLDTIHSTSQPSDWSCQDERQVVRIVGVSSGYGTGRALVASVHDSKDDQSATTAATTPRRQKPRKASNVDSVSDDSDWASSKPCALWICPNPARLRNHSTNEERVVKTYRSRHSMPFEVRCITPLPIQTNTTTSASTQSDHVKTDKVFVHDMVLTEEDDMFDLDTSFPKEPNGEEKESEGDVGHCHTYSVFEPDWSPSFPGSSEEKEADSNREVEHSEPKAVISPPRIVLPHAPPPNGIGARRCNLHQPYPVVSTKTTSHLPKVGTRISTLHSLDNKTRIHVYQEDVSAAAASERSRPTTPWLQHAKPLESGCDTRGYILNMRELFF